MAFHKDLCYNGHVFQNDMAIIIFYIANQEDLFP